MCTYEYTCTYRTSYFVFLHFEMSQATKGLAKQETRDMAEAELTRVCFSGIRRDLLLKRRR